MILRRENDLAVLRIRLDRRGGLLEDGRRGTAVVVELVVGTGEAVELGRVPPAGLGLPGEGLAGARDDLPITLPGEVLGHSAIAEAMSGRSALWLELPAPSGPLRPLAWESALAPLGVPVLRLPYFALRPVATDGPCTIAICASSPAAKGRIDVSDAVERFVGVARERLGPLTRIHVFTDERWSSRIAELPGLRVHDPRGAADYGLPRRSTAVEDTSTLQNPWLMWMRDQLAGTAVDHVHFLCHGFLAAEGGAVALASSPLVDQDRISRFVGSSETVALLSVLGAWSVGYTGPDGNYSELGLRALADAVAEVRPGPVLAHETAGDRDFAELGRALALAIGPDPTPSPRPGRAALWIHPQRLQQSLYPTESAAAPGAALLDVTSSTSLLFGPATTAALAAPDTPSWVASSARVLEQAQGAWLSPTQTGPGDLARDPGWSRQAESALRLACDLLEAHVVQAGDRP